jgi:hypothetical protein
MKRIKSGLTDLYNRIFRDWKTVLAFLFVVGFTLLMAFEKIQVSDYIELIRLINTIASFFTEIQ